MKLIVQGDDYGFTKGVTYGIIEAIDNGCLTATGMFTNMDIAPWAAEFIKARPDFCFGVDFNLVAGAPISDPKDVPHLVEPDGNFHKSGYYVRNELYATEEGRRQLFPYDEVYRELRAQYDRFVELTGRKPGYLHPHSIMPEPYLEAIRAISKETGIVFSQDIMNELDFASLMKVAMKSGAFNKKVFDPIAQLNKDCFTPVFENTEYLCSAEYAMLGGHPGYVDADLLKMTTLSLERCKDLDLIVSPEFKKWIEDNHVELISYYDLVK